MNEEIPLVAIVGATASGKTAVAVEIAEQLNGEIISADAVSVYRYLDIGAAKPDASERARAQFHLIDVADPDEDFSLGDFTRLADAAIADIRARGKMPIVAGGTGLYVRGVTATLSVPEVAPDETLREELRAMGAEALFARLQGVDPVAAAKILPGDVKRMVRALEVFETTGKPMTAFHTPEGVQGVPKPNTYIFCLDRERTELYRRIETRVDVMLAAGLVAEVQGLLDRGYQPSLKSMTSLGYRHVARYLLHNQPLTEAVDELKRDTRRFAKRQLSWFRADAQVNGLAVGDTDSAEAVADALVNALKKRITGA